MPPDSNKTASGEPGAVQCGLVQTFIEIEGSKVTDTQVDFILARTAGILMGAVADLVKAGGGG